MDGTDPILPPLQNGFSREDIESRVRALNSLAVRLRAARVEAGALRIDQVKVSFVLDPISGKPIDFVPQEQLAAHRLIEEFMLLANTSVAEFIQVHFLLLFEKYTHGNILCQKSKPKSQVPNPYLLWDRNE